MSASNYLLELRQRRATLLENAIHCLGIPLGSLNHEVVLKYAVESLTHHHLLDTEAEKVQGAVCDVAEKLLLQGYAVRATRLLRLSSSLTGKSMQLEGHRMVPSPETDMQRSTPLGHPFAALALLLALSEASGREAAYAKKRAERDNRERTSEKAVRGYVAVPRQGIAVREFPDGNREGQAGDEVARHVDRVVDSAVLEESDVGDLDLRDWLQAFENSSDGDEGQEVYVSRHHMGHAQEVAGNSSLRGSGAWATPQPFGAHQPSPQRLREGATPWKPQCDTDATSASKHPPDLKVKSRRSKEQRVPHCFGQHYTGTEMVTLEGDVGRSASLFLRPCQTLVAYRSTRAQYLPRHTCVPESEVVRAVLHMLQGFPGEIFVRVEHEGDSSSGRSCATSNRFALSSTATSGLAIASLSPETLASVLEDFIRLGSIAEYLRAFVADADASSLLASAPTEISSSLPMSDGGGCAKHGITTNSFVACVRRHTQDFQDAIASHDRWLYRTQRGLRGNAQEAATASANDAHDNLLDTATERVGKRSLSEGPTGETLLGLLELVRDEAECLELVMRLVTAGAVWWSEIGVLPDKAINTAATPMSLRARTGRLLDVLYEAVVEDGVIGRPSSTWHARRCTEVGPRCRRRGWLLRIFFEVLAPYLDLLESWTAQGRLIDSHGELFLSRVGTERAEIAVGRNPKARSSARETSTGDGEDCNVRQYMQPMGHAHPSLYGVGHLDLDPVFHVWDAGVVVHLNALPKVFGPLAPAVALAGQDISLMHRVRILIATIPDIQLQAATGFARLGDGRWGQGASRRRGNEDDEPLSLKITMSDSLRRLAQRVLSPTGHLSSSVAQQGQQPLIQDDGKDSDSDGVGDEAEVADPSRRLSHSAEIHHGGLDGNSKHGSGVDRKKYTDDEEDEEDGRGAGGGSEENKVLSQSEIFTGDRGYAVPRAAQDGAQDSLPSGGVVDMGMDMSMDKDNSRARLDTRKKGGGLLPHSEIEREMRDRPTADAHAHAHAHAHAGHSQPFKSGIDLSLDLGLEYRCQQPGIKSACAADDIGWGTSIAQDTSKLAISSEALLGHTLHPSLAPLPIPRSDQRGLQGRTTLDGDGDGDGDGDRNQVHGSAEGGDDGLLSPVIGSDGDSFSKDGVGASADVVAETLPPAMVIETCLLAPLRERCRLISSNCLRVFLEELGLMRIAGVLRQVFLSPGGARNDSPLSHLRSVLFGALASLSSHCREDNVSGGVFIRDIPAFLEDGPRLTALLHSSLSNTGLEGGSAVDRFAGGSGGDGDGIHGGGGRTEAYGECLRAPLVGADCPLLEHFLVSCHPKKIQDWGTRSSQKHGKGVACGFPMAANGKYVDLRVFTCWQLECRLPWPQSVALPPRAMEKYSRAFGLLIRVEFVAHMLEASHVLHSRAQRGQPRSSTRSSLDRRHMYLMRLFAFLHVARAVHCYLVTQALVEPWSEFLTGVPRCKSLRGFIRLHEEYLDTILERCFLLPRNRQVLAYILDVLEVAFVFAERYGEYTKQFDIMGGVALRPLNSFRERCVNSGEVDANREAEKALRNCLARLEELWGNLKVTIASLLPLLKEMVRSRSGVYVHNLLLELNFDHFFQQEDAPPMMSRCDTRPCSGLG